MSDRETLLVELDFAPGTSRYDLSPEELHQLFLDGWLDPCLGLALRQLEPLETPAPEPCEPAVVVVD